MTKIKKPKASIVTVTYNLIESGREDFFKQCLESVYNQKYENFEHIVVDGGSTDGSVDLIKKYASKGWVKYISEPDNGIYDAMNKGIKMAKGAYVAFLNSDDYYLHDDVIALSVQKLIEKNADFSFGNCEVFLDNDKIIFKGKIEEFLCHMSVPHPTMFVKADVLKSENGFDEKYGLPADYELLIRLVFKDYKSVYIDNELVGFRVGGATSNFDFSDRMAQIYMDRYAEFYKFTSVQQAKNLNYNKEVPFDFSDSFKKYYNDKQLKNINIDKVTTYLLGQNTKKIEDFQFYFRSNTSDEEQLMHSLDMFFIPEYVIKKSDIVIDVGACIGTFAIPMAKKIPQGKIYAIEAQRDAYNVLQNNLKLNNIHNIESFNLALSDHEGASRLYFSDNNEKWWSSLTNISSNYETVDSTTLRAFMEHNNINECDFVRFDCEGSEFDIIMNSTCNVLRKVKLMLVLYHCDFNKKYTNLELIDHLITCGFEVDIRHNTKKRGWIIAKRIEVDNTCEHILKQKNKHISSYNQKLQQKEQKIKQKEADFQQKEQKITQKDQELQQKEQKIIDLSNTIKQMQSSQFWKLKSIVMFPVRVVKMSRYYAIKYKKKFCSSFAMRPLYYCISKPDVAVCILFYNKVDQTIECLQSFLKSGVPIYVLDNQSDNNQRRILNEFVANHSHITIFSASENIGVARGRNYLIEHTVETWLFFVDSDITVVKDDWLVRFSQKMNNNKSIVVFIPKLFHTHENLYADHAKMVIEDDVVNFVKRCDKNTNMFPGGAAIISRKYFDKIGLYDCKMFVGFEAFEIAIRAIKLNKATKAIVVDDIELIHEHRYLTKAKDQDTVEERYDEDKIAESEKRVLNLHNVAFCSDWRDWARKQAKKLTIEGAMNDVQIHKKVLKEIDNYIKSECSFDDNDKTNFLFIVPWLVMGGSDKVNLDILNGLYAKGKYNFHIITTLPTEHVWGKKFEKYTKNIVHVDEIVGDNVDIQHVFMDRYIYWAKINGILVSNSTTGYTMLEQIKRKYPHIYTYDLLHGPGGKEEDDGFPKFSKNFDEYIDARIVISDVLKKFLINKQNISSDKINVIKNGVDIKKLDKRHVHPNYFGDILSKKKKNIVYLGRLGVEKHPEIFVEIANSIREKYDIKNMRFVIAGDGPMMEELRQKVERLNLQNIVVFLGRVDDVAGLLCVADVLIMTSETEGIPIAMLESLSMSVPVIATRVGGIPEIMDDGVEGKLIDYNDDIVINFSYAINELFENTKKYQQMSDNARKKIINQFSLEQMINKYHDLFNKNI